MFYEVISGPSKYSQNQITNSPGELTQKRRFMEKIVAKLKLGMIVE